MGWISGEEGWVLWDITGVQPNLSHKPTPTNLNDDDNFQLEQKESPCDSFSMNHGNQSVNNR